MSRIPILQRKSSRAALLWAGMVLAAGSALAASTPLLDFEFNEGSGTNTTDSVSHLVGVFPANPVTVVTDAPSGAAGDNAVGLNLGSATSQGMLLVDDSVSPILALTNAFTMEAWIRLDPSDVRATEGIGAYGGSYKMGLRAGELIFTLYGIVDIPSGLIVPLDGAWHHTAAVWEPGTGVTLYLDGTPAAVPETRVPRPFSSNILTIGAEGPGSNALQGSIDRFRMHGAALTADQLDSTANAPKGVLASTLVAYNFNEAAPPYQNAASAVRPATPAGDPRPDWITDTPSGKSGDSALHFQAPQQVVVDDSGLKFQLDPNDPSFTVQAWVKFSGNPSTRQVLFFNNGPGGAISFSVNTDRTVFVTTLGILDADSKAAIPDDGNWHHIAVVHENGKELRYYVDGILGDTRAYTSGVIFTRTDTSFYIGSEPTGGLQYIGSLDRLKVTSGVLTPDQLDFWPIPGVQPGSPELSIGTVEQISWPTVPAGYKLQSSTDLGQSKNWADVTNAPSLINGSYSLFVPPTQGKVFYRLFKP